MTARLLFESDRRFSLFGYAMSHGLLLLRSGKTNDYHTRVDVLIRDVRAMELRSWFQRVVIEEVDKAFLAGFRSNPIDMVENGNRVFSFRGDNWAGFVVGGVLSVHEDDGDLMGPSALLFGSLDRSRFPFD